MFIYPGCGDRRLCPVIVVLVIGRRKTMCQDLSTLHLLPVSRILGTYGPTWIVSSKDLENFGDTLSITRFDPFPFLVFLYLRTLVLQTFRRGWDPSVESPPHRVYSPGQTVYPTNVRPPSIDTFLGFLVSSNPPRPFRPVVPLHLVRSRVPRSFRHDSSRCPGFRGGGPSRRLWITGRGT